MKKIISLTSAWILFLFSYGIAAAAPSPSNVVVVNTPTQPIPITAPAPLNVSVFRQPFTLYDSGILSAATGTSLDIEVAATNCGSLLACVFNYSAGATNLPITLDLDFVYPGLAPPACTGTGVAAVTLLTFTVNSSSASCVNYPNNIIPPCLRVVTSGQATSYSVLLLCQ